MAPMPDQQTEPRPFLVSVLGWFSVGASLLVVLAVYEYLGRMETIEFQRGVETWLSAGDGAGVALSADQLTEFLRIVALGTGALAASAVVLSVFVMQRHNGARIGLTVVAALLLMSYRMTGSLSFIVAAAATMLWSPRIREWFAPSIGSARTPGASTTVLSVDDPNTKPSHPSGDEPTPDEGTTTPSGEMPPPPPGSPASAPPPPATSPYGQAPPPPGPPPPGPSAYPPPGVTPAPPPGMYPPGAPGMPPPAFGGRPPRPSSVLVAAVLTWVSAGLTLMVSLLALFEVVALRSELINQIESSPQLQGQQFDAASLTTGIGVAAAVLAVWSLSAVVLAIFVFRGQNWARILLAISAGITALVSLVTILAIVPFFTLVSSVTVLVLLFVSRSNQYFRGQTAGSSLPVW